MGHVKIQIDISAPPLGSTCDKPIFTVPNFNYSMIYIARGLPHCRLAEFSGQRLVRGRRRLCTDTRRDMRATNPFYLFSLMAAQSTRACESAPRNVARNFTAGASRASTAKIKRFAPRGSRLGAALFIYVYAERSMSRQAV